MEKFFYRVETGDSVLSLSQKFNVPVCKLVEDNNLKSEIKRGELLFIERKTAVYYKVKPFDKVEDIAKKFCVSKERLLKDNAVNYIFYGLILKIY